jgi:arylsulfatase A-like enzyme
MKKIGSSQMIAIVANVGVIAGIIFLAIEVNQNTAMIEAEMSQSRAETALGIAQSLYNSDYLPEILVVARAGQQLTDVQKERLRHWFRGFNRNQDNLLRQYHQGLLTDDVPRSIRSAIRESYADVAITTELWERTKLRYSDDYINLVDEVLAEGSAASEP